MPYAGTRGQFRKAESTTTWEDTCCSSTEKTPRTRGRGARARASARSSRPGSPRQRRHCSARQVETSEVPRLHHERNQCSLKRRARSLGEHRHRPSQAHLHRPPWRCLHQPSLQRPHRSWGLRALKPPAVRTRLKPTRQPRKCGSSSLDTPGAKNRTPAPQPPNMPSATPSGAH